MNTDTHANHFKDSLLAAMLEDFDNLASAAPPPARYRSSLKSLPARRTVAALAVGTAAAAVAVAGVTALSTAARLALAAPQRRPRLT